MAGFAEFQKIVFKLCYIVATVAPGHTDRSEVAVGYTQVPPGLLTTTNMQGG